MKIFLAIVVVCAVILIGTFVVLKGKEWPSAPVPVPVKPLVTENVKVFEPLPGAKIKSPLVVRGEARGTWYFEASFPVRLKDAGGREIAVMPAQANGEWMTTDFVPFEVVLNFEMLEAAAGTVGTLILEKDNPSGLPEHNDSVSMSVVFE